MRHEVISSRSNPLVTHLRKLGSKRSARREEGVFVGEGPKLLRETLKASISLETVIYATGVPLPDLPQEVRLVEVPSSLLEAVAQTQTPQGVVFVGKTPSLDMPQTLTGSRYLLLDGVQDPGNVGTIWRTADAFGADGLILCSGCADPWSPKTVRSTMGAAFRLPVWETTLEQAAQRLKEADIPLYATALREDTEDVRDISLQRSGVIIGSEGRGVSQLALDLCEKTVKIPMVDRCESLNAAVAASVVLWEMARAHL
ncbi:RNA methyltransferase [Pseudoflavonifractor sp. An85]|uniref:TrmH family RNA methyltransferase n=1 Tax=Pseudoflavonifractor sp. An85 TaxID=1965661 RepID=UPI000B377ECF|nr:RNA methyltransferase [Pseudoflavonifractor sp. An85]OUN25072.1 RNA methyltransferase [Pseudoflavonifractor sp. An85]